MKGIPKAPAFALVTGGSQGIGFELAKALADQGLNIALVALPGAELEEAAKAIRAAHPGLEVRTLGLDLTDEASPAKVYAWATEEDRKVRVLVNNAGFGTSGVMDTKPIGLYLNMMKLNNQAMASITYHFMEHLRQSGGGHVLNMSSMEATVPLPYKAVYAATKAFVYNYSQALRVELAGYDVNVTVVCPGPTVTNEEGLARIKTFGDELTWYHKLVIKFPDYTAQKALRGLRKRSAVVVPGTVPGILFGVARLLPASWKMNILARIFRNYKDH
ncbi:MAG: SDR family NAD(P)-dependent oxidoreductase [Bacteroidia bacterium]